jgi:hypothetical protein
MVELFTICILSCLGRNIRRRDRNRSSVRHRNQNSITNVHLESKSNFDSRLGSSQFVFCLVWVGIYDATIAPEGRPDIETKIRFRICFWNRNKNSIQCWALYSLYFVLSGYEYTTPRSQPEFGPTSKPKFDYECAFGIEIKFRFDVRLFTVYILSRMGRNIRRHDRTRRSTRHRNQDSVSNMLLESK